MNKQQKRLIGPQKLLKIWRQSEAELRRNPHWLDDPRRPSKDEILAWAMIKSGLREEVDGMELPC